MNGLNKEYINIITQNDSFYIETIPFKPKNETALSTLNKIKDVLERNLSYYSERVDEYSNMPKDNIYWFLGRKAEEILKQKIAKEVESTNFIKNLFYDEYQFEALFKKIKNLTAHLELFPPLPNELVQEIIKYLELSDVAYFAQINHLGKAHAKKAILTRAREVGYQGHDEEEAEAFLKDFYNQFQDLCKNNFLPEKCLAYKRKKKGIDSKKCFQNLSLLNTEDLFSMFSREDIYSPKYEKIKFFLINRNWVVSTNADKENGEKALFFAVDKNDNALVELLLKHGLNPNKCFDCIQTKKYFLTLALASFLGKEDIVKTLLQYGADVNRRSSVECNALSTAVDKGHLEIVKILLKHGADPNLFAYREVSVFHLAALWGRKDIVQLLLENGAKINDRGNDGGTALSYACGKLNLKPQKSVIKILLGHGADLNIPDDHGSSPLHFAAQKGSLGIVRLLLQKGARINDQGSEGSTALNFACGYFDNPQVHNPNAAVVKFLLEQGADPNIPANNGSTPLQNATKCALVDTISHLIDYNAQG